MILTLPRECPIRHQNPKVGAKPRTSLFVPTPSQVLCPTQRQGP